MNSLKIVLIGTNSRALLEVSGSTVVGVPGWIVVEMRIF